MNSIVMRFSFSRISFVAFVILFACHEPVDTDTATDDNTSETEADETITAESVTIDEALSKNSSTHEAESDYTWGTASAITLNGTSISTNSSNVTINGASATITAAGTYSISGTLTDGQIHVNTSDETPVWILLNGVSIHRSTSSPLYIEKAKKVIVVLLDNTTNTLSDGTTYVFESATTDEPNATLFSKADLTVYGNGSLKITANYNDGIASKDGLVLRSGEINVTAKDDGVRGKDYLVVRDARLNITSGGDGLTSDNEDDASLGYVLIDNGSFNIVAAGDGLQAETDLLLRNGAYQIITGGGSTVAVSSSTSAKGIKGTVSTVVEGGTYSINASDDAIHSNGNVTIAGGTFSLSTGDDGLHADVSLTLNGGDINVVKSYEGFESAIISINNGTHHILASDDGVNVAGGNDGSGTNGPGGSQAGFSGSSGNYFLYVHGGYTYVNASGDGVDVNGGVTMTKGTIIVDGPTANNNAALDYDQSFKITGGFILAVGSSGMAQMPDATSTQNSALITFSSTQTASKLIHLQTGDGKELFTFKPAKNFQSVAFSSPDLVTGGNYEVYLGGSTSGTQTDGLYSNSGYSGGTKTFSFSISGVRTTVR